MAEVVRDDLFIVDQVRTLALKRQLAMFQEVSALGRLQRSVRVLFYQQDGQARAIQPAQGLKHLVGDERRQPKAGLIEQ